MNFTWRLSLVAIAVIGHCSVGLNAQELDLNETLGNPQTRQEACSNYELPVEDTDLSFLGPYESIVVGTVNYTYHRFGPLAPYIASDNTSLVLVPGSGATSAVWQADFLKGLAQDREVITFDPRGYGSADTTPVSELTIDSIASSLVDFFDALELDTPHILGWSWGGTITLWLGAFYGDSVGRLVALSTTSGGEGLYRGLDFDNIIQDGQQGQAIPPAIIFPDTDDGNEALCRFIAFSKIMPGPTFTPEQIISQGATIATLYGENTLSDALANITQPVFVGHGTLDLALDIESGIYLADNLNSSKILAAAVGLEAGHAYLFQDLGNVVSDVSSFLDAPLLR